MKKVELPPVDEREALRYAQYRGDADEYTRALLKKCVDSLEFSPRVVYLVLKKEEFFAACEGAKGSESLQALLKDSERVVLFVGTIGMAFDYALERCQYTSLAEAGLMQGIGAERVEAVCDVFCNGFENATRRFSPGYGDLPLETQKDIFRLLDPKQIGVGLTDSLMMTPSKSVTAIFGLKNK